MKNWDFNVSPSSDWWRLVCIAAAMVLLAYAVIGRLWERGGRGIVELILITIGVGVTAIVVIVSLVSEPGLHGRYAGLLPAIEMLWTFGLLGLLSITFYLELIGRLKGRRMVALLIIRIIALAMAVPMLFEPVLQHRTHKRSELLILVDTSGSMSFPDVQNGNTRIQSVWATISPQLERIDADFDARYCTFATGFKELSKPQDLATIAADGRSTDIALGLNALSKGAHEDGAIAIFTDGIDNTSPDVVERIRHSRVPIHTLRVGSELTDSGKLINIAVADVDASEDFVVHHESPVTITIKSSALANRVVDVKMAEVDDKGNEVGPVVSQKLVLQSLPDGQKVTMPYTATAVGKRRIAVWVDPVPGERSIVDNRQEFQGLAIDPRVKVLYIESLRPEYKFLNQLFLKDPNIEWCTYLQLTLKTASDAAKVEVHGTVDGAPFLTLPNTPDGWRKFDVIIIGDQPSSFFSRAQQEAIAQAVENGSGLLMIGGKYTLGPGKYQGTPIENVLPVFVGPETMPQEMTKFVPRLTGSGAGHPAMEGLAEFFGTDDTPGVKNLPPLRGNVVVAGPKPGAQILLVHKDTVGPNGKPQIVLAVQRNPKGGSTAVFTGDTTNYWTLELYGNGQDSPFNRFWGQLVRWLANRDVRERQKGAGVDALLNKTVYQLGESVRVRAMVHDELGYATRFAQVSLKLKQAGSDKETPFTLQPVKDHVGMYDLLIPHPDKGDWTAELSAVKDGKLLGKQDLKFSVIPPADEFVKLAANPKLLIDIAESTRGTYRELGDFAKLLDTLSAENASHDTQVSIRLCNFIGAAMFLSGHEPTWDPKYDLPMQAALVFLLLSAEWILRRVWQLT